MNRRPKFWIHRNGRFWHGLGIIASLYLLWLSTTYHRIALAYTSGKTGDRLEFTISHGAFIFTGWKLTPPAASRGIPSASGWEFETNRLTGVRWLPKTLHSDFRLARSRGVLLPLWIPLAAGTIFWLLWLRHAHKKEKSLRSEAEADDSGIS